MHAQFRIPASLGGDDFKRVTVEICNDTGSNYQSIYRHDFDFLNGPVLVGSERARIMTAHEEIECDTATLEMRIVQVGPESKVATALTDWYWEQFVIKDPGADGLSVLLSGARMRNKLYFATAPGNAKLYVAEKKNGIIKNLPV